MLRSAMGCYRSPARPVRATMARLGISHVLDEIFVVSSPKFRGEFFFHYLSGSKEMSEKKKKKSTTRLAIHNRCALRCFSKLPVVTSVEYSYSGANIRALG